MNSNIKKTHLLNKIIETQTNIYANRNIAYLKRIKTKLSEVLELYPEYFKEIEEDNYGFIIIVDNLTLDVFDFIFKNKSQHLSNNAIQIVTDIVKELHLDEKKEAPKTHLPSELFAHGGDGTDQMNSNDVMDLIRNHSKFIDLLIDYFNNL